MTDGDAVGGTDIAAGTTVQSIAGTTLTLSANAILSAGETLSVSNIVLTDRFTDRDGTIGGLARCDHR